MTRRGLCYCIGTMKDLVGACPMSQGSSVIEVSDVMLRGGSSVREVFFNL